MGSPVAPRLVNLFMDEFETFIFYPNTNHYLDKIFFVEVLSDGGAFFSKWINGLHSTIKFKIKSDKQMDSCLDTEIYTGIYKEIYKSGCYDFFAMLLKLHKATGRNLYLLFGSFHSYHLKANLPYAQFLG